MSGPMTARSSRPASTAHRAAFDLIVERHRRAVYQVCFRFVGNHEDASDLAQDVFFRAYRALGKFKGDSALGTWLYRIAVNVSLNRVGAEAPAARVARRRADPRAERDDGAIDGARSKT